MPRKVPHSPSTQFKPGKSGNPNGQPRKLPGLDKLLGDISDTDYEEVISAIFKRAKKGDVRAAELILNRAYGKPKENEGLPTEMIIRVIRRS